MKKLIVFLAVVVLGLCVFTDAQSDDGRPGQTFTVFIPLVVRSGGPSQLVDCEIYPALPECAGVSDQDQTATPGPSPTPTDTPVNPTATQSDQEPTVTGTIDPTNTPTPFGGDQDL